MLWSSCGHRNDDFGRGLPVSDELKVVKIFSNLFPMFSFRKN